MAHHPARIVVKEIIYHQFTNEQPSGVEHTYERKLTTDEQPYGPWRKLKIGEHWQELDLGWFKGENGTAQPISVLILRNDEGHFKERNPTPEERAEAEAKVVEIAFSPPEVDDKYYGSTPTALIPNLLLPPREKTTLLPVNAATMRVRCQRGIARCSLTIFPG